MRDLPAGAFTGFTETILFLQGPPSNFWPELAETFRRIGWTVKKIHTSPADALFWRGGDAEAFSGDLDQWRSFFAQYLAAEAVGVVALYADRTPYHKVAIEVCDAAGVQVRVFENGYLRPDWITCENGGMGRYSRLPSTADGVREAALGLPHQDVSVEYPHPFFEEAWREVVYHLSYALTPRFLWRFDHGRYYHPLFDYLSFAWNSVSKPLEKRRTRKGYKRALTPGQKYFFVPLQVQCDYSIHDHSDYAHIGDFIEEVMTSFAEHADPDTLLLFKTHPYDNGSENWRGRIEHLARRLGVSDRVITVEGGPFGVLVKRARGMVLINSTSGLHALRAGRPVIALGDAVYDIPGMTHQGGLDSFWRTPEAVDRELVRDFLRLITNTVQVKGSFFNAEGRARACRTVVERMTGRSVPDWVSEPMLAPEQYVAAESIEPARAQTRWNVAANSG